MTGLPKDSVVAVIGAGTMGRGIAQVAAQAGHRVLLFDQDPTASAQALEGIAKVLDRQVAKGRLDRRDADAVRGRLEATENLDALASTALVIEAIVEALEVKRSLFSRLEEVCPPTTILASNTSSFSITEIAEALERPERLIGLHFFNPAPVMRLVEVISGQESDPQVVDAAFETMLAWGKTPVRAASTPGFIVNRVARPFYGEAFHILEEGFARPATIDAALRDCGGFAMGPLELTDLIGQDVNDAVTRSVYKAFDRDPRYRPSTFQKSLIEAGRLGRKSGRGIYDYGAGAKLPETDQSPTVPTTEAGLPKDWWSNETAIDGDALLLASDGRSASQRAQDLGRPVIVFDHCLDYRASPRVVIAASQDCPTIAIEDATGRLQALGKTVTQIEDRPGLIVLRTLAMLANEAAEAVHQDVATPEDIDTAMLAGVNYPIGPLAWADRVGAALVLRVIEALADHYQDKRYRPSPLLRRKADRDERFLV